MDTGIPLNKKVRVRKALFISDVFTVTNESVRQGQFAAIAVSPTEIKSSYRSAFRQGIRRDIGFKFSINGQDNERLPSEGHLVFLNPVDGKFVTPIYTFDNPDPAEAAIPEDADTYLAKDEEFDVMFRVDMRKVLADFKLKGYYEIYNGTRIKAEDFKSLYIMGDTEPLTWDFGNLANNPQFELTDPNGDGIYEVILRFSSNPYRPIDEDGNAVWTLQQDVSDYPQYESSQLLVDALYKMSLEEMLLDICEDGAFMAGAEWPGVWTRDISYSILLALAIVHPEASRRSLMAKVKDGRIIQDTGTGGSWPVSSDRMTWALAAWEVYAVTGDERWLRTAYDIIKRSAEADLQTVHDPVTGLICGESSFLDWREQSYPRWMDAKDIYKSRTLGTNAVHYQTYRILGKMAELLGEPSEAYFKVAGSIKNGINTYFWMADRGYYGQYLYGRNYSALSPRAESLGETLCVLFDIASETQQIRIIANTPVVGFGTPSFYPQIPNIPAYHNDGIFLFIEAYWTWASAKRGNSEAVEHGLASFYRAVALFLTNKEVMAATTGNFLDSQVSSDRQLWTIAGNLAMVYRIFYGMMFYPDCLVLHPFIPKAYDGTRTLKNFKYRDTTLTITINGYGHTVDSVTLDGQPLASATIPGDMVGDHTLVITMKDEMMPANFNLVKNYYAPETPQVVLDGATLRWDAVKGARVYQVYRNGELFATTVATQFPLAQEEILVEYQVLTIDEKGFASFLSEPIHIVLPGGSLIIQPLQTENAIHNKYTGYTGDGYVLLTKDQNTTVTFTAEIERPGTYSIDFRYANGNGLITNKVAIRTLKVDGQVVSPVVMPQRDKHIERDWGYSNSILVDLLKGRHSFTVGFTEFNENMNSKVNDALLDHMRLTLICPG